jgi:citrate synthase
MSTTVTHDDSQVAYFGATPLLDVVGSRNFSSLVFELLTDREPTPAEHDIIERILCLTIDHGPDTPSAKVVRERASAGMGIGTAVAAGIETINEIHGGAQDALMPLLYAIHNGQSSPEAIVREYAARGDRIPGFGHRIYTVDPRTTCIFDALTHHGYDTGFRAHAEALKEQIEQQLGKRLPINVDGGIAVALCEFGMQPPAGSALFIIARTAGLCGQYLATKQSS